MMLRWYKPEGDEGAEFVLQQRDGEGNEWREIPKVIAADLNRGKNASLARVTRALAYLKALPPSSLDKDRRESLAHVDPAATVKFDGRMTDEGSAIVLLAHREGMSKSEPEKGHRG